MKRKLQVLCALWALPVLGHALAAHAQDEPATAQQAAAEASDGDEISEAAAGIVAAARAQVGDPYDASYVRIPYPNGDIPNRRGLCADVVVRALRGVGFDLQFLIHEDRKRNFRLYPRTMGWGRRGPDSNSDHRTVPNQMFFLSRFGMALPKEVTPRTIEQWQPGDIVYWKSGSPLNHAGIVSDEVNELGVPLVIHMSDKKCVEDDSLLRWPVIGHFRFPVRPDNAEQDGGDAR